MPATSYKLRRVLLGSPDSLCTLLRSELGRQQLSGSLNSEGDRYSYADSQGSSDRSHSDDEGDPQNEPLLDNPYYRKLQDLNR